MHLGRTIRRAAPVLVASLLLGTALAPATAEAAAGRPSLRLLAAQSHITVPHFGKRPVYVDPGILVTPVGGTFRLELHRPSIGGPVSLTQVWTDDTGTQERTLASDVLRGWDGLRNFFNISVRDAHGKVVHREIRAFCPNAGSPERLKPVGASEPSFPAFCGGTFNPFIRGSLWGIDNHWAMNPIMPSGSIFDPGPIFGGGIRLNVPNGTYQVRMAIMGRYRGMFGIDLDRAVSTVRVTIKKATGGCPPICRPRADRSGGELPPLPDAPLSGPPDPLYLPDLGALPAFRMYVYHRFNHDYLSFASTEWVGGGSDLDVQGFRRHNSNTMDAYQYFFRDGEVVGKAKVGTLEFDTRPGHQHWHFEQFARYRLLDRDKQLAVRSHKQSFCIAPTDPIDLTIPNASMRPDFFGFLGNCGTPTSVWVHEKMALGWGDTYLQDVAGQAFDITKVPNGTYFVSIEVNPLGLLYEQTTSNDQALRRVVLRGSPGHRRICVPAINGVDQEGDCRA
jgi:hypothetical protein